MTRPVTRTLAALLAGCALAGCTAVGDREAAPSASPSAHPSQPSSSSSSRSSATPHPDAPTGWGPTRGEYARARRLVEGFSLDEKVGSLLMPRFAGRLATDVTSAEAAANESTLGVRTAAQAIRRYHLAGVIVFGQNVVDARQVRRLNAGLAAASAEETDLPLLIGVDQEGGTVARVRDGATVFPAARTVGSTGRPAYARLLAHDSGVELRAMGFRLNFAPDADVGFGNPAIGSRSYSADPQVAARMVAAAVDGYRGAGIVPVVKHFPGHGSAVGDSHATLAPVTVSRRRLERADLVPFRAAVRAGVPCVLTGHLDVRAVDPGHPSSLSREVVTGMLRDELGFGGVAFTDSEEMEPIADRYGTSDGAVRAVLAGEDVVLMPPDLRAAYRGLKAAARSGRIPADRLDRAATRVTALRLYAARVGGDRSSWSKVDSPEHHADVHTVLAHTGG